MTATFIVEDGTENAAENAYLTEAEADQYHDNYGASAAWTALAQADKEAAIREATQWLDAEYGRRWKGARTGSTQRLDWPRVDVDDRDGRNVGSAVIPEQLKDATAFMALESLSRSLRPAVTSPGSIRRVKKKMGPMEKETEYLASAPDSGPVYPLVDDLLHNYLIPGTSILLG